MIYSNIPNLGNVAKLHTTVLCMISLRVSATKLVN